MREKAEFLDHIKRLGFAPATILDVGVAWGTPELYAAFPQAYFHLFEPLEMFGWRIADILKRVTGEWHQCALSDKEGKRTIYVRRTTAHEGCASIFHVESKENADAVQIELRQLDSVLAGRPLKLPLLLKTDAQGADIEIMKGAPQILQQCGVVIMEVAMFPYRNPENQLYRVIPYMTACGFVLYDLLSPRLRPYDRALGQLDAVFVRNDSNFRAFTQWA